MRRREEPTERRVQMLRAIRSFISDYGEGPTVRQLGRLGGLSSTSSVAYQLARLEQQGLISRSGHLWRSMRLGP